MTLDILNKAAVDEMPIFASSTVMPEWKLLRIHEYESSGS